MLLGQFEHTIDAKFRLTLPARYRERFDAGIVLAPGMDGCIAAYTVDSWSSYVEQQLLRLDPLSRDGRTVSRYVFGRAVEMETDKAGRVQLPAHLREHASLDRSVIVAGVRDHLEVWDVGRWTEFVQLAEQRVEAIADGIAEDGRG